MVAYLSKSNASEGFNQIINFLNGSSIKYALTVDDARDAEENVDEVNVGDVAHGEVLTVTKEPSIPSPSPPTSPPQPPQDIPSTS
nr:hypothetical protein [Tanacetum cinerariifolium]